MNHRKRFNLVNAVLAARFSYAGRYKTSSTRASFNYRERNNELRPHFRIIPWYKLSGFYRSVLVLFLFFCISKEECFASDFFFSPLLLEVQIMNRVMNYCCNCGYHKKRNNINSILFYLREIDEEVFYL